jgi:ferredoxin--NADP+ reductase
MRIEDYPTEPQFDATIMKTERITEELSEVEVRELVLEVDDHAFNFEVGQSIGVLVKGPAEFGGSIHHRLYTVADTPLPKPKGKPEITIVVRRCSYIDDYSGFGIPFNIPDDKSANLLLIGLGTGIAPFRALVKKIYHQEGGWKGKVMLLYGARSGLELLYMNNKRDDFTRYYDEGTFEAIKALSPRPNWVDPIAWDYAIEERAEEIWKMLSEGHTYVYVAGLEPIRDTLDRLFGTLCGSTDAWLKRKAELIEKGRWVELLY